MLDCTPSLIVSVRVFVCLHIWEWAAVSSMSNVLLSPWRGSNYEINHSTIEQPEEPTSDALNVRRCHGNRGGRFSTSSRAIRLQAFFELFLRKAIERWEGKISQVSYKDRQNTRNTTLQLMRLCLSLLKPCPLKSLKHYYYVYWLCVCNCKEWIVPRDFTLYCF